MRLGKKYVFLCKSVGIVCKKQLSLHQQKKHYSSLKQFDMKNLNRCGINSKKVLEKLTRYIIDLQKQIDELKKGREE